jgi:hypothetical protein
MVSISPLENHEYKGTRGICWEIRHAHARMSGLLRLSPLENAEYKWTRGICWEMRGLLA